MILEIDRGEGLTELVSIEGKRNEEEFEKWLKRHTENNCHSNDVSTDLRGKTNGQRVRGVYVDKYGRRSYIDSLCNSRLHRART